MKLCHWTVEQRSVRRLQTDYVLATFHCSTCGKIAESYYLPPEKPGADLDPYKLPCGAGRTTRGP